MAEPQPSQSAGPPASNPPRKKWLTWIQRPITWVMGIVAAVIAGVMIAVGTQIAEPVVNSVTTKQPPPVHVKVVDNSVCNFVAPLSGKSKQDPTKLGIGPDEFNQGGSCAKPLHKVHGALSDLSLEAVLAPTSGAAVVLTDVTLHVRKSVFVGKSAFYSPAGSGGGGETLNIYADVEKTPAVSGVDVYAEDGSLESFTSVLGVRPRPIATKSDPLIVDIELHGDTRYTTFDIDLHWQSSTASGVVRLDNKGAGYTVAGIDGLPPYRGTDGDMWEPGSN